MEVEQGGTFRAQSTPFRIFHPVSRVHAAGRMWQISLSTVPGRRSRSGARGSPSVAGSGLIVPSRDAELLRWCLNEQMRVVQLMTF